MSTHNVWFHGEIRKKICLDTSLIYCHNSKEDIFSTIIKVWIFFLFIHKNICCGYSLETPQRGASNEYLQHMFSWRNKKNMSLDKSSLQLYNFKAIYITSCI